jgi:uncharacterized membrane protein
MNHYQEPSGEKRRSHRFVELDMLRGFAIIFMIILHIMWDLDYFGILPLNKNFYTLNIIVPIMFFLLVGICQAVNNNKYQNQPRTMYLKTMQRGLWILNLGMLFTVLTVIVFPDRPILFGVLHCIGLSILLSALFLRLKSYNIILAMLVILAGITIANFYPVNDPNILQLAIGFHQPDIARHTIDYFPILPWLGVCLLGIVLGNILYKNNERRFPIPDLSKYKPTRVFSWLGQHSLAIYLLHQPVIAGVLFLVVML